MIPDWLITIIWFIAGICATGGFWYFLSSKNLIGTLASAFGTVVAVALAIFLHLRNDRLRKIGTGSVETQLLSLIWSYPLIGENEASWAVKESAALMGDLGTAREKPGLGVAIITTELALAAFGDAADSRIDLCISWGVGHAEKHPPFRMQVVIREPIHYEKVEVKVDFRHTLAFAIILARTRKQHNYLVSHLRLALEKQNRDGGWPSDSVATVSPVFTAFYGVELLHLAFSNPDVPADIRNVIPTARAKGLKWLMDQRGSDGLWSSSVLRDFAWDRAFAAAWVLHRLAPTVNVGVKDWQQCLDDATYAMVQQALDPKTWVGSTEAQRHRVEARIAAAASRVSQIVELSPRSLEVTRLYRGSWRERAHDWLSRLPSDEIDVGTAAFLVYGLVPEEQLPEWGQEVLKAEARNRLHNSARPRHGT